MGLYSHINGKLGLICFIIYLIMLIKGRRTFSGMVSKSDNYLFVFICMALYSVLGFLEPDTYNYYEIYKEMAYLGYRVHVEPFYYWLSSCFPHSYFTWRLIIWGTASFLIIQSAKMLALNSTVLCYIIPLLFLTQLSVTRGALGISLMLFCVLLLMQSVKKNKTILIPFAILGLSLCFFLHKSMIVFLGLMILSLFVPLNKRFVIITLVIFPFLYKLVLPFFTSFGLMSGLTEDQVGLIMNYQNSEKMAINTNGVIMTIFEKTILLLLLFNIIKKCTDAKTQVSKGVYFLSKYTYVLIYFSFLFLGQEISDWISIRTLHAASFSMVFCAAYCFDTLKTGQGRTKIEKIILIGYLVLTIFKQFSFIVKFW